MIFLKKKKKKKKKKWLTERSGRVLMQATSLRSSVTVVRCLQHGYRIAFAVLLGLVIAGCQRGWIHRSSEQHLRFSRKASAGVLKPRDFRGVELMAQVRSSMSRAV